MIHAITVTNYLGESIKLELSKPDKSGFVITSITGLGPGKANINTSEVSTNDGGMFNSARLPSRNIVISVKYLWKNTIEDARQLSYKYFPIKRKVSLEIETDNRLAAIDGYVESNDPDIFSQEEGSDISIICPSPFFYSAYGSNKTTFGGIEPAFEFPFSNESLTEPLLEFSQIRVGIDRDIVYMGDFEVGVTMYIRASGEASGLVFYNTTAGETMTINSDALEALTGSGIVAGDELVICTVKGKKSATLIRNGQSTNILNCIGRTSDWFQISKGSNIFAYTAETGRNNLTVEIENDVLYEGV